VWFWLFLPKNGLVGVVFAVQTRSSARSQRHLFKKFPSSGLPATFSKLNQEVAYVRVDVMCQRFLICFFSVPAVIFAASILFASVFKQSQIVSEV
jgi:hypothetical protein